MLIQGNCVKVLTGKYDTVINDSIEAPSGQSLLIKRILCTPSSNDTFLTLQTDRVTVGCYRVAGKSGNHLSHIRTAVIESNVMDFLAAKGINVALPVAEGQVFTVSRYGELGNVVLVFDRYDAGDIRADMPNGSAAKEYVFMQYMNIVTGRTDSGNALFDTALSPAEFPDFPCGKSVPANHRITMLGLVGCPWRDGQADSKGLYTTHIRLVREREVLFDEDRNGIPFDAYLHIGTSALYAAGFSLIGAGRRMGQSGHSGTGDPLIFDPPLVFEAGVELNVYAVVVAYGTSPVWTADLADLAAILKVEKV